ncbi:MAG TPA: hypothetical protein VD704_14290, partial [Gaiellaceae bacterium]|nr:hypothetical protein [Gaiellaceae bacterium]
MSAPDALETLRRHDPAAGLAPAEAEARERLRRTIVAEPVPAPAGRKPRGRGRLVLVVAALALVLSAAAAWGVYTIAADSPEEVRRELEQIKTTIPLPPGAAWDEPGLRDDSVYGRGMALTIALSQATCKWLRYWDEGDAARRADALSALRGLRALMPLHPEGAPEDVGGYDENTLRYMDDL